MADIEAVEVLTQAKERLFEHGWTTGAVSTRADTSGMCLEEAIVGREITYFSCMTPCDTGYEVMGRVADYIRSATDMGVEMGSVYIWNDQQQSAGPVFDALDRAMEIAKEAPNPAS